MQQKAYKEASSLLQKRSKIKKPNILYLEARLRSTERELSVHTEKRAVAHV